MWIRSAVVRKERVCPHEGSLICFPGKIVDGFVYLCHKVWQYSLIFRLVWPSSAVELYDSSVGHQQKVGIWPPYSFEDESSVNGNKIQPPKPSKNKISLVTRPMVDHRAWPYSPPALTRHLTLTWPESLVSKHNNFLELMGEGLTHSTPTTNTTTHTPTNTTRTSRIDPIDITKSCHEKVLRRTFPQGPGVSSNWKLPPLKCRL